MCATGGSFRSGPASLGAQISSASRYGRIPARQRGIGARIAPSKTHDVLSPLHNDERTPLWDLERSVAVTAYLG